MPGIFDIARIAADQDRADVVLQVRRHGKLAAVQRGVAHAVHALVRDQLQGDEVAAGAGDDDLGMGDFSWRLRLLNLASGYYPTQLA